MLDLPGGGGKVEATPELVCPGFFVDRATWAGAPLSEILGLAGLVGSGRTDK